MRNQVLSVNRPFVLSVAAVIAACAGSASAIAEPEQKVIGGQNAQPMRGVNPGYISPNYTPPPQTYIGTPRVRRDGTIVAPVTRTVGAPTYSYPWTGSYEPGVYLRERGYPSHGVPRSVPVQHPQIVTGVDSARLSTGGGLFLNGTFTSGDFVGAVRLGTPPGVFGGGDFDRWHDGGHHHHHGPRWCFPSGNWGTVAPRWWFPYYNYYSYGYPYYTDSRLITGIYTVTDPQLAPGVTQAAQPITPQIINAPPGAAPQAPQQPVKPAQMTPTDEQLGWAALAEGRFDDAVVAWRDHLRDNMNDVPGMRAMGFALIGQRKVQEGTALIALAYETDPTLAYRSVADDLGSVEFAEDVLRRIRTAILNYANTNGTSSAYLAALTVLQAEGKIEPARRMLKKAEENGLEARVADELRKALRTPGSPAPAASHGNN